MTDIFQYDNTFSETMFKSKVEHMFTIFYNSIMQDELSKVEPILGDKIYKEYENKLKELRKNNLRQMFEEVKIKSVTILSSDLINDKLVVKVLLVSEYIEYLIDKSSGQYVYRNETSENGKRNYFILEKKIDSSVKKCQACGANININQLSKCEYCGTIFNIKDYDWVITEIRN